MHGFLDDDSNQNLEQLEAQVGYSVESVEIIEKISKLQDKLLNHGVDSFFVAGKQKEKVGFLSFVSAKIVGDKRRALWFLERFKRVIFEFKKKVRKTEE